MGSQATTIVLPESRACFINGFGLKVDTYVEAV
jgi:hypothetical protein